MEPGDTGLKKILFLISDKEVTLTGARIFQLLPDLTKDYEVTVATNEPAILRHIKPDLPNYKGIVCKPQEAVWNMKQRDKFAKKFISSFHDIKFPNTDMPMWKAEAFDDYLWNVSQYIYPQVEGQFDLVLAPTPSLEEPPGHLVDEFFTAQYFKVKEQKIPIMGYEVLPIQFLPLLHNYLFDYFAVKSNSSVNHLKNNGIESSKIFECTYPFDNYCIDSVEDTFKHFLFKATKPKRNEFNITVMNHVRLRDELKAVFKILGSLEIPVNVNFGLINYAVKEIHEIEILRDVMIPEFQKHIKKMTMFELPEATSVLISSDCFVTCAYMTLYRWCDKYNIPIVKYEDENQLRKILLAIWDDKKKQIGIVDAVNKAMEDKNVTEKIKEINISTN